MKNKAKKDGPRISVVAATINEESRAAAAVMQEIGRDLNVIALSRTQLPHPIVIPPTVGRIPHTSGEVACPEVDDGVKVINETLTGQFDQDGR